MQDGLIFGLWEGANFSENTVMSTKFIAIERWYYFVNFFCRCRSYYERIIDFWWQEIPEWFWFWVNNFSSRGKKVIESIETESLMYFLSLATNEGVSLFFASLTLSFLYLSKSSLYLWCFH